MPNGRRKSTSFYMKDMDNVIRPNFAKLTIPDSEDQILSRFQLPADTTLYVSVAQIMDLESESAPSGLTLNLYDNGSSSEIVSWSSFEAQIGDPLYETNANIDVSVRVSNNTGDQVKATGFLSGRLVNHS